MSQEAVAIMQPQAAHPLRRIAPPFFPDTAYSQQPTQSTKPILCKIYPTAQGCSHGQKCRFVHEKPGDVSITNAKPGQWEKRLAKELKAVKERRERGAQARSGELLQRFDKLVGEARVLPGSQQPKVSMKTCKFFQAGYCSRASKCHFQHPQPSQIEIEEARGTDTDSIDPFKPVCSICYEAVEKYGLMKDCSHAFCYGCIRNWRTRTGKSQEVVSNLAATMKTCPLCRKTSPFITPSSLFHAEGPRKAKIIETYMKVLKEIPCRYLQQSTQKNPGRGFCPFGDDCHYSHLRNGERVVFNATVAQNMPKLRVRRINASNPPDNAELMLENLVETLRLSAATARNNAAVRQQFRNYPGLARFFPHGRNAAPAFTHADDGDGDDDEDAEGVTDVLGADGTSLVRPRENILPSGQPVEDELIEHSDDTHSFTLEEHFDLDVAELLQLAEYELAFEGDHQDEVVESEFERDDWGF